MPNNLQQIPLKLLQKEQFKKQWKQNKKEIPKKRCISPEERQKIIDDLRLM